MMSNRSRSARLLVSSTIAALAAAGWLVVSGDLAAQSSVITEASIRGHLDFLASDALQGRGSGTYDERLAATYIGSQMRRWGIEPLGDNGGYVQQVDGARPISVTPPAMVVGDQSFASGDDMLVQGVGKGSVSGTFFKYTAGADVPGGAFVLVTEGTTPASSDLAAAAVVLMLPAPGRGRGAGGRVNGAGATGGRVAGVAATGAAITSADPTRAVGAGAARGAGGGRGGQGGGGRGGSTQWRVNLARPAYDRLVALPDGVPAAITANVQSHTWNAIGRLEGSDPSMKDQVILLTAHLDHLGICSLPPDTICNGADDDGSGTTAVLELAEAIAKGPRPKRTVIFAWFGSEERGGAGARHFLEQPPVPLKQIVANVEFEMMGRADPKVPPHTLWLTGYERSNLGPELAAHGARIVQDPHPEQNFFARSDNIQLAQKGVIAQTVSSFNLHADYHRPSDEIDKIDFAHMTESIQSMLAPMLWLANSGFKPEWKPGMCPAPCSQ